MLLIIIVCAVIAFIAWQMSKDGETPAPAAPSPKKEDSVDALLGRIAALEEEIAALPQFQQALAKMLCQIELAQNYLVGESVWKRPVALRKNPENKVTILMEKEIWDVDTSLLKDERGPANSPEDWHRKVDRCIRDICPSENGLDLVKKIGSHDYILRCLDPIDNDAYSFSFPILVDVAIHEPCVEEYVKKYGQDIRTVYIKEFRRRQNNDGYISGYIV